MFYAYRRPLGADCRGYPRADARLVGQVVRGGTMQLLIAHGDAASRAALEQATAGLKATGFDIIKSAEGMESLELLLGESAPAVAIVDWDLPGLDGAELCRLVRQFHEAGLPHIILLARSGHDIAEGLNAGASDCMRTPVNGAELRARVKVGHRMAALPWDKVLGWPAPAAEQPLGGTVTLSAQRSINGDDSDNEAGPAVERPIELAAQRTLNGDDRDDGREVARETRLELSSVLVAQ